MYIDKPILQAKAEQRQFLHQQSVDRQHSLESQRSMNSSRQRAPQAVSSRGAQNYKSKFDSSRAA